MGTEGGTKILLVDDDADDRLLFTAALAEIGNKYHCDCAASTMEALRYLASADPLPDLIFLDLNMPGYDGKKCLRHLKAATKLQNIPVVIYSTFISEKDEEEMKGLGADYVITKPGDFGSLQTAIIDSMETVRGNR